MKRFFNDNPTFDGLEAFSITERMKLFFADVSIGIDKLSSSVFNGSIHTVPYLSVTDGLKKKNNYFEYSGNQIPIPVFFNSSKTTFREYTTFCLNSLGVMKLAETECQRLYDAFKRIVHSGEVPFAIRHWDMQSTLDQAKTDADKYFFDNKQSTAPINTVYKNVNDIADQMKYFNDTVKGLKSRDVEVFSKQVDNLLDLIKLVKRKVDVGDLKFSSEDTVTMEIAIGRLSELVSQAGIGMSRLNELTRVFELQIQELKRYC